MAHAGNDAFAAIEGAGQTVNTQSEPALLSTNHYMLWYSTGIPSVSVWTTPGSCPPPDEGARRTPWFPPLLEPRGFLFLRLLPSNPARRSLGDRLGILHKYRIPHPSVPIECGHKPDPIRFSRPAGTDAWLLLRASFFRGLMRLALRRQLRFVFLHAFHHASFAGLNALAEAFHVLHAGMPALRLGDFRATGG